MSRELKDTWKKTGVGLGHAFRDLGKSVVKTVADVAKGADEHVNGGDKKPEGETEQVKDEAEE